jgi:hypothetical protein
MNHTTFWQLIDQARAESRGDRERLVRTLEFLLQALPQREIVAFERIYDEYRFRAYRSELWAAAGLLNGGCSDDGFEYFRGWLIAQGERVYEEALRDPDSLAAFADPNRDDYELEAMLYAPGRAYEARTGRKMPPIPRCYPKLTGEELSEEDLDARFPRIVARLNG